MLNQDKRRGRRKTFAAIGVIAGVALIVLEVLRPQATSAGERWFWLIVGALLIGMGVTEFTSRGEESD